MEDNSQPQKINICDSAADTAANKKIKFTREEKAWIMYDWANSVYATIMMAAVFPIFFTNVADAAGQQGDYWWGIGTAVAMLIVAVLAPILGALSDFKGYRMKLFSIFFALGVGVTFASAFFANWWLLLLGYAISHIGFSGSCLVYDSFLAEVTTSERMHKVSGYGFAMGYIGGSTIPFLVSIALIMMAETIGITVELATRISVGLAAVWWGVFTIPFFKNIKQKYNLEKPKGQAVIGAAFKNAWLTMKKIAKNKKILFFIVAYFFYIDGVGTVINMSTAYGATLGLDTTGMILALLVTQIVAFPCSIWFSSLSNKFGSLKMIRFAVSEYLAICIVGFIMGLGLEELNYFGTGVEEEGIRIATTMFWILAFMVGTVQGGIQAISRSHFCQMIPPENTGEFFGFFEIFGKFAAVMGPALYAIVKGISGSSAYAILSIISLFLIGLVLLGFGNKHFKEDAKVR